MLRQLGVVAVIWFAGQAGAGELVLQQPIACTLGRDCVIQQFMDHDKGDAAQDFACGGASYDGHKGTDFRISTPDMDKGIAVLAAADGIVLGLRDAMIDRRVVLPEDQTAVAGKECGNGVVLRHGDGWETQYCHMKQGSVLVSKGQQVKAGQVLGQVGLSGKTQFPHLHLSVRQNGEPVDPFAPDFKPETCVYDAAHTLWDDVFAKAFSYQPGKVIDLGLADRAPDLADVVDGRWSDFVAEAAAPLVIFGLAVNGMKSDQMQLILTGPEGEIVNVTQDPLRKNQAQWFAFAGKRPPTAGWTAGEYTLTVRVLRSGDILSERKTQVHLAR